jgi:hypothetical protein
MRRALAPRLALPTRWRHFYPSVSPPRRRPRAREARPAWLRVLFAQEASSGRQTPLVSG